MIIIEVNNTNKVNHESASSLTNVFIGKTHREGYTIESWLTLFFHETTNQERKFSIQFLSDINPDKPNDDPQRILNHKITQSYWNENLQELVFNINLKDYNKLYWIETDPHYEECYLAESETHWLIIYGIYQT